MRPIDSSRALPLTGARGGRDGGCADHSAGTHRPVRHRSYGLLGDFLQLTLVYNPGGWLRALALGLIAGGAAGNLINRLWSSRGVVDFIDVGIGDLRWPTFNFADVGVSIGAVLLAGVLWREDSSHLVGAAPRTNPPGGG